MIDTFSLLGGEAAVGDPAVCGAGSMTITELTTTTTHLHTKTTTIGPSQPRKQLPTVGGALPREGVASGQPPMGGPSGQWSGMPMDQGSSGTSALYENQRQKPLIQYRMFNKI